MNITQKLNPYLYHIARVAENVKVDPVDGYQRRMTLFHEIEWITSGSGRMMTNGEPIEVTAGDILYREPGVDMKAYGDYQCYLLVFDPFIHTKDEIATIQGNSGQRFIGNDKSREEVVMEKPLSIPSKMHPISDTRYKTLFMELSRAFSSDLQDKNLVVKIKLLEILNEILNDTNKSDITKDNQLMFKRHSKMLEIVIEEMNNNPKKKIILEEMANKVGLSKYHFSRLFKVYTGVNISTYHKNLRLNHAKHLLMNTDDTIESIAIASGFETPTYFYKVFRKNMNSTPLDYRELFII